MISAREAYETALYAARDAQLQFINGVVLEAIKEGKFEVEILKKDLYPRNDTIKKLKELGYHFSQTDKAFLVSWGKPVLKLSH